MDASIACATSAIRRNSRGSLAAACKVANDRSKKPAIRVSSSGFPATGSPFLTQQAYTLSKCTFGRKSTWASQFRYITHTVSLCQRKNWVAILFANYRFSHHRSAPSRGTCRRADIRRRDPAFGLTTVIAVSNFLTVPRIRRTSFEVAFLSRVGALGYDKVTPKLRGRAKPSCFTIRLRQRRRRRAEGRVNLGRCLVPAGGR